jgi:thiamine biosynthesis lipoprotein
MNSLSRCKPLLGTYVEVSVWGRVSDRCLIEQSEAAFRAIAKIHNLMSFHCPESELSKMNRLAVNAQFEVSEPMLNVLQLADSLHKSTHGLFDLSVAAKLVNSGKLPTPSFWTHPPTECFGNWADIELDGNFIEFAKPLLLDLGGIAKGFAVDQAIKTARSEISMVVNAGGDIAMTKWQNQTIGIKHHNAKHFEVPMLNAAVASSSSYYHGESSVIINPLTGQACKSKDTYTAFAASCMIADAMTKVACLAKDSVKQVAQSFGAVTLQIDSKNAIRI